MDESPVPGLGDLIGALGGSNLLASIGKTIDQFKRSINDFLTSVENFNKTMEMINGLATRANSLFDEVEEPIRALMPQVTRSIKAADALINQLSGPIDKVAPGISRLADTLSNPVFTTMPTDIAGFLDTLGDVARRLQPLAQMAESAGSLFGLRPLSSLLGVSSQPPTFPSTQRPPPPPLPAAGRVTTAAAKKAAPRNAARRKAAPKKAVAKKAVAKKAGAKKVATKKAPATRAHR